MAKNIVKSEAIIPRIDGIENDVQKLKKLGELSIEIFSKDENFVQAQFYFRQALEGVFHIGSHVLARIPGGRAAEYKDIALKLGEVGIVPRQFAQGNLKRMAGYRNRLTHFYADVTPQEIHKIISENLSDFDIFLRAVRDLIKNPEKFGLSVR